MESLSIVLSPTSSLVTKLGSFVMIGSELGLRVVGSAELGLYVVGSLEGVGAVGAGTHSHTLM